LVERESLQIRAEPGRQAGPGIAAGPEGDAGAADRPAAAFGANNTQGEIEVAAALNGHGGPHGRLDFHSETFIAFNARQDPEPGGLIDAQDDPLTAVAISFRGREDGVRLEIEPSDVAPCLRAAGGGSSHTFVQHFNAVRRLTPLECERLQGFPEGYTDIPFTSKRDRDGLRYEALGESMAVPVMRWLGERIAAVDALPCAA
jgi:DNA (cytosine-5)-methyltransferase 1